MREPDVLDLAAREHRELQRALRRLVDDGDRLDPQRLDVIVSSVARHEAMDRLLLYPLVGRDPAGRRSLNERRAEQRSISDQLAKALRTERELGVADIPSVLEVARVTFVGHSDREEIEDFPQARRSSSLDERHALAELRHRLRDALHERLPSIAAAPARTGTTGDRLGPVQVAIVNAKELLAEFDRSTISVA